MATERTLGKAERFYWLYDQVSCTNFVLCVEPVEPVDDDALKRAFAEARDRHPLLASRITVDAGKVVYVPADEAPFPVARAEGDLDTAIANELDTPFPPGSYPLVRCIRIGENLLFTFNHSLTDARGAANLVHELVAGALGHPLSLSPRNPLPDQVSMYPAKRRGLRGLVRLSRQLIDVKSVGPVQKSWTLGESRRTLTLPLTIDAATLLQRCRAGNTTIHGLVTASQLLALREKMDEAGPLTMSISSAVDMRPLLVTPVQPQDLGMYISVYEGRHRVSKGQDQMELAREVRASIARGLDRGDPCSLWVFFPPDVFYSPDEQGARKLANMVRNNTHGTIVTNIGRIEAPSCRRMSFAMAPQHGSPLCTAVVGLGDEVRLNLTFDVNAIPHERAEALTSRIGTLLQG